MIKDNQKYFNRLQVALDAGVTAASYLVSFWMQFSLFTDRNSGRLPASTYMLALVFVIPAYLLLYDGFRLYKPKRISGRRVEAGSIFLANMVGLLGFIFVLYLIREQDFSRQMLFLFTGVNFILLVVERNVIRILLHRIRRGHEYQAHDDGGLQQRRGRLYLKDHAESPVGVQGPRDPG